MCETSIYDCAKHHFVHTRKLFHVHRRQVDCSCMHAVRRDGWMDWRVDAAGRVRFPLPTVCARACRVEASIVNYAFSAYMTKYDKGFK